MSDKVKRGIAIAWLIIVGGSVLSLCAGTVYTFYQINETFRELTRVMAILAIVITIVYITLWSFTTVFMQDN